MFLQLFKTYGDKEYCYYLEIDRPLSESNQNVLDWLLDKPDKHSKLTDGFEIGPRMEWVSPWSSTVQAILNQIGLQTIKRIEFSVRTLNPVPYDRMTQEVYSEAITRFKEKIEKWDCSADSISDLRQANIEFSFGWDEQDIEYYQSLFQTRTPRLIELFDLAQGNSEHCRHWFFNGKLVIDDVEQDYTLFDLVKKPYNQDPGRSLLAFCDNASVTEGSNGLHLTFKAETHNFPTGISPFPGAETGVGGRQRDSMTVGRGGLLLAGTAGYCVADLNMEYMEYKSQMAQPIDILIQGSNGVSDYGNKVGEPLVNGFCRTFGVGNTGWVKPILFSGGVGQIRDTDVIKQKPSPGDLILKLGGPAYRIGLGGSTASSKSEVSEQDFDAVQRGDPLMNQKVSRVIKGCIQMGEENPIITISDQGAGGNSNVLKELLAGTGAEIELTQLNIGDKTMTPLELWIAEYQEAVALVIKSSSLGVVTDLCEQESCPFAVIGEITQSGRIQVAHKSKVLVDLNLQKVLEDLPQKTYRLQTIPKTLTPLRLPNEEFGSMVGKVLRLPSVASKRYLVTKVDRSVGGLVIQQQCVGPLQIPVSDYALMAQEFTRTTGGVVTAIGEKPLLSLINPEKMARMAVAEAITNLMFVQIEGLKHVKLSANWMWPDKDADLVEACQSLSDFCIDLGVVIDGGKDSLSMRVQTDKGEVRAPGMLTISAYAFCPDIRKRVTPQLSPYGDPIYLLYIPCNCALGGSALAQCYDQIGNTCPDVSVVGLRNMFNLVQDLLRRDLLIAGHDCSDGGLITTLLEMCFAGNCGMELNLELKDDPIPFLFHEGVGVVIQTIPQWQGYMAWYTEFEIMKLGYSQQCGFDLSVNKEPFYMNDVKILQHEWERTSYLLDAKQSNPETAKEEFMGLVSRQNPMYNVPYTLEHIERPKLSSSLVMVLRTEGTNGHREMAQAFNHVGFLVMEVTTHELLTNPGLLTSCKGLVFPGGFSFGDVLGAGKGFAALLKYNQPLKDALDGFYRRKNTFSLGVCNGFQLMTQLKILPRLKLVKNRSQRFESRMVSVRIEKSNCIFFKGMEGAVLPVWVAHGEGKVMISRNTNLPLPIVYTNHEGKERTHRYPFSPNGTHAAGACSLNGRHLGMMPHPERCFLDWQLPYNPQNWKISPWLKMFQNAYDWCHQLC
jgi:phosphoribosylformylglycinamidine synthase